MPYKNIVYAKLERRLLGDHRWYMMSETAQLIFIKLILLAQETYNKIPKNLDALRFAFKTKLDLTEIESAIKEVKNNFKKFRENKHYYYFLDFDEKTNYISDKDELGKSQGTPKEAVEKKRKEKNIIEYNIRDLFPSGFPGKLNTEEFKMTWENWEKYRKETKHKLTGQTIKLQIKFLEHQPDPIAVINKSIENGWRGLFPIKDNYENKNSINRTSNGTAPGDNGTGTRSGYKYLAPSELQLGTGDSKTTKTVPG